MIKDVARLYKPGHGAVYIDGQPLSRWNVQSLRIQIALVAQDDSLLQGPLAAHADGLRGPGQGHGFDPTRVLILRAGQSHRRG